MNDTFESLYQAKHAAIYRHCLSLLGNPEDAAEATQEVFSRLLNAAPAELGNPGAWLHRVAHNHCMNRLRSRRREVGEPRESEAVGADPEQQALARVALTSAFASLTPRERRALARSTIHDRSIGSVARDLGMTYMAAAQLLSRARRRAAAVAGTVVGLGAALARRPSPPRPSGAGGLLSNAGQNAVVAVAAVLVAGTAALHMSSNDSSGQGRAPAGIPALVVTPPPGTTAAAASMAAVPPTTATPAPQHSTHAAPQPSGAPAHTAPPATAAPSSTPAPVIVGAGPYRCNANPASPSLSLDCVH
jgi:RNA polymerase sigma-70 factor, ECF subfamily